MDSPQLPTPDQLPQDRPRPRWRSTVAGAVAGGVLAAAVAVPVTWAIVREDQPPASTSSSAPATADAGYTPPQTYSPPTYGGEPTQQTDTDDSDATDDESQGLVLIDTTLTDGEAAGTGLVLDESGLVVTNYHVVEGSTSVQVTIAADGTTYDAEVVGHDQASDIAVLQLDGASGLATVDLDDDGDPAVSDPVTAVGNADGQGYLSAAAGTVVALDRSITTESSGAAEGEHLTGLIETDASVVGGYSGGALLDDEDEVVGITTAASSGGVAESYAIPIEDALGIVDRIESGTETGDVQIGPAAYLGVGVVESTSGLRVGEVEDGTAADQAGIEAGDTITSVDGTTTGSFSALTAVLAAHQPGDEVVIRWRDSGGESHRATATLGSSPIN